MAAEPKPKQYLALIVAPFVDSGRPGGDTYNAVVTGVTEDQPKKRQRTPNTT